MSDSVDDVQRLQSLATHFPNLEDAIRLYKTIGTLLEAADLSAEPVSLAPDQAGEKLARGVSLLQDVELRLNDEEARRLLLDLVHAVENTIENIRNISKDLRQALEEEKLEISRLMAAVAAQDQDAVRSLVQPLGLDSGFVWTLTSQVFKTALHSWCRQLSPLLERTAWDRSVCPICGSLPVFAELQGNHQHKHLRCGRCGADWPARRLHCLYCGNEDHRTLGVLFEESRHDTQRVEFCERCRSYLKVIVSFAPSPPEHLSILDLATIHMNYLAEERGYRMRTLAK